MNQPISIHPICSDNAPMDLLYEADESKEAVGDYLNRGKCYIAMKKGIVCGVFVLLPTRPFTIELVNICVHKNFRHKGIAKKMIAEAVLIAKQQGYKTMEIGTGNCGFDQLALYQKCGFTIAWIDRDFFPRHYPEPIFENGLECRHMVRLSMDI